jgi:hypothetical protein
LVKLKVREISKFSEDELASRISSRERWIDWYHSQPDNKITDVLKKTYFRKYLEMKEFQLESQKFTAVRKDIGVDETTRSFLEDYFSIAQKEIDLVKSGVDPDEDRRIAFNGTRYEET